MGREFAESSYLFAGNAAFVEELYQKYLANPASVDRQWQEFFLDHCPEKGSYTPSWVKKNNKIIDTQSSDIKQDKIDSTENSQELLAYKTQLLLEAYRDHGHLAAKLDPLGMQKDITKSDLKLELVNFGLENDLDKEVSVFGTVLRVGEIESILNRIYCSSIGFEIAHIHSREQQRWLIERIENNFGAEALNKKEKLQLLQDLEELEGFEQFLHTRFPGAKRFSVEGGEASLISVIEVIKTAATRGKVEDVIIGMAHRGRLNLLTKIMCKDYAAMFAEFKGTTNIKEDLDISGDVKYHLGRSRDLHYDGDRNVHISLTANPSHLEAVNPVVTGKVRAKQDLKKDLTRSKVLGILVHGDAAFCGQGVVAETLSYSDLEGYNIGGTMHIVTNNQIGFTAVPREGHTSRYPTEFAKIIQAPIIHVNGDDAESVIRASRIAEEFRLQFKKDVVIDVFCYRKYGHNEGDEPMFTQPLMYKIIGEKQSPAEIYSAELVKEHLLTSDEAINIKKDFYKFLDNKFKESETYSSSKLDWLEGEWAGLKTHKHATDINFTGLSIEQLKKIGIATTTYPKNFALNSKLVRLFEARKKMMESGKNIDWATAEAIAFGSLLIENYPIRISGQDVKRGTFSHRHAVVVDQETQDEYISLNHLNKTQAKLEIVNSNLSEFAVLGFEYGYSLVNPYGLTIWEGQFGDFANGAQIIIDQFISSSEIKWLRMSGLVLLLPHGYEGQGPEHSSARLERFLQLCASENMQVVNCTTPANFFHLLRRQLHREYRKPLVVMSPKSLLRNKMAVSRIEDMSEGSSFMPVIDEINLADKIRKLVICSGKVYYDLLEAREKNKINDVALVRVEQYYPFPKKEFGEMFKKYKDAEICWCQEEPKNMGAWSFIRDYLELFTDKKIQYAGRSASASTATGYSKAHLAQQDALVNEALK